MMNGHNNKFYLVIMLIVVIGLFGFFIENNTEQILLSEIEETLTSMVKTTHSSVRSSIDKNKQVVKTAAALPEVFNNTKLLLLQNKDEKTEAFDDPKSTINSILEHFLLIHGYQDYIIINRDNEVLISSTETININDLSDTTFQNYFKLLWQSGSMISYPYKSPSLANSDSVNENINIYKRFINIGSVIKYKGETIAALIFVSDVDSNILSVFSQAQIGESGKTYGTSEDGILLTRSRYKSMLVDMGLIAKNDSASLNIQLDKNSIILSHVSDRQQNPLTVNTQGYTDYRGIKVVGAWLWDPLSQIYIISEIDEVQAYSPIYNIRQLSLFMYAITCLIIFGIFYYVRRFTNRLIAQSSQLEKNELRLRLAIENIPTANIVSDSEGIIVEFNKCAEVIFGYEAAEVLGRNVKIIVPEPHQSSHDNYIKNYIETGKENVINQGGAETSGLHKDGSTFPIHLSLGAMVIDQELHFIASVTDQTIRTKMEKQMLNVQKMHTIGQLTGGLAHDFNNLLGIAMGNLQLLEKVTILNDNASRKVDTALKALNRGATLTSQLLNFTREREFSVNTVDINNNILAMKDLIEQTASKSIEVSFLLSNNLGSVAIDQGEFGDVIINLTANARDAIKETGKIVFETKTCATDKQLIQFSISDTGRGMSKDVQNRIFEPFFTTKQKYKGTGLGLTMTNNFINKSNARIEVFSEIDMGTTFIMYFPISKHSKTNIVQDTTNTKTAGNETILLVDDENELLTIAEAYLSDAGYTIYTANSGKEALKIIENTDHIDLLLSDVIMPGGIDGMELTSRAFILKPDMRIALTSGYTGKASENIMIGDLLGSYLCKNLLTKPYNGHTLLSFVRKQLDRQQIIKWSYDYIIGVPAIDNDHRALVLIINRLHTASTLKNNEQVIDEILTELINYTVNHFEREEIVMKACHFPDFDNHRKLHLQLIQKVKAYTSDSSTFMNETLLEFLINWLINHIGNEDIQIAEYAKGRVKKINNAIINYYKQ